MDKKDLILGKNALREAIAAEINIQKIFISETLENEETKALLKLARAHKIPILRVAKPKLDRLSRLNHQGVIAITSAIDFYEAASLVDHVLFRGENPGLCICDGITDVRNFGAIARSAEIFGIHGLIIGQKNSAPINSESIKASSGALLSLPVCREKNLLHTIKQLKSMGLVIISASEKADLTIRELDMKKSLAFVLGSEGTGVSPEILTETDAIVKIPQKGTIQSLNVSVAAGIFFYEWMLQNKY
ncbi:MAG: 23S rRNA (guanosine(2251)-2'-O)-methyltransferase RlmB [Saprospiraceae bacterium]|nr:23S rRNA (guanosine(2251)-2'-O)-methyltransferase RlmB [Saprospiraceae bacterium]